MKIVIFGLTISSSWGNGHATLWRGLCSALARAGHDVVFYEHDTQYYRSNRDFDALPAGELVLYDTWSSISAQARRDVADADIAMVTSYCPDAIAASDIVCAAPRAMSVFYDLDTPVTLSSLRRGEPPPYIGARGLRDFDLVLSYTGGAAVGQLSDVLGARRVHPLYGHVDPDAYRPVPPEPRYRSDLSYLGTFAEDRQQALELLLVKPASIRAEQVFMIGGALYPKDFPWSPNIFFVRHLPPTEHPAFFCSSRLTLNITRRDMAAMGWCPSGRLFEASACGTPILSDFWEGLDAFFEPGQEIFIVRGTDDVLTLMDRPEAELRRVGSAARERVLDEHTSEVRARQMIAAFEQAHSTPEKVLYEAEAV
jgi:spore maturation protein CgeB